MRSLRSWPAESALGLFARSPLQLVEIVNACGDYLWRCVGCLDEIPLISNLSSLDRGTEDE